MNEKYKLTEQERAIIAAIRESCDPAAAFILALEIIQQLSAQPPASVKPLTAGLPAKT